jgi:CheY-like chemotaxis protein
MGSIRRNGSRPAPSWRRWVAALRSRLERLLGYSARRSHPVVPPALADTIPRELSVLVVDDNPSSLADACSLLKQCGISPRAAVDGVQAVALARVHDFDLILMDLNMPVLDGLGATMQIRAREKARSRPRAPVLAYTSSAFGDDLLRACGIDGVLAKPCSASALQECLRCWCGGNGDASWKKVVAPGVRLLQ